MQKLLVKITQNHEKDNILSKDDMDKVISNFLSIGKIISENI